MGIKRWGRNAEDHGVGSLLPGKRILKFYKKMLYNWKVIIVSILTLLYHLYLSTFWYLIF